MTTDPPTDKQPRNSDRVEFRIDVHLRRLGGQPFLVQVFDASPTGCKMEFVERLSVGERVWIKFDGLESILGEVRWIADHVGAVTFIRPLHDAVFARLAASITR